MQKLQKQFKPLFKYDKDWQNNACLNICNIDSHISYSLGYREAANLLVQQATDIGKQDNNCLNNISHINL